MSIKLSTIKVTTSTSMLKDLFVSEVRIRILKTMLKNPEKAFHVRGLVRAVNTEINAVRRELDRLTSVGLLRKRQSGNRIYYNVNTSSILFPELLSLVSKEEGLGADIIRNIKKLGGIEFAVVSRAFLRGRQSTVLDVDLFIVGTVNMPILEEIIKRNEKLLGKEINYTVMPADEFIFRKRKNDSFISRLMAQSRTMLIGDEEEFCTVY
jgi:predicted transcriptional regulator/predicted nucleotidyltransferase